MDITIHHYYHHSKSDGDVITKHDLQLFKEELMATFQEVTDQLTATATQLDKVTTEYQGVIQENTDLKAQLAAAQAPPQALVDASAQVATKTQTLDDLTPDVPTV